MKESQREQIRKHLLSGKSITSMDSLKLFGAGRLASRIEEIRKGYNGAEPLPIESETIEVIGKNG